MKKFNIRTGALILLVAFIVPAVAQERDSSANPLQMDARDAEGQAALKRTFDELLPKAESGDPKAQYQVGRHFDFGWGVEQDGWRAVMWYEKAATQGYVAAQVALANLYAGAYYGYLRNEEKAFHWFSEAAKKGDSFSQAMLGDSYASGQVVPRNYRIAAEWYKRAIEGGYFLAPYKLARLYADGKGLPLDLVQAYAWNSLSAAAGNGMARQFMDSLESRLSESDINRAQELAAQLHAKYGSRIESYSNRHGE